MPNRRIIKAILSKKFKEWSNSITESEDQLIEIGTGASAALAIYLQRNIIEML